jgi:hypothetical protein
MFKDRTTSVLIFVLIDVNIALQKTNTLIKSKTKIICISKITKYLFNNLLVSIDKSKSIFAIY